MSAPYALQLRPEAPVNTPALANASTPGSHGKSA